MVYIQTEYLGGLRCQATHGPSQSSLLTDAPIDNHGQGASFSPTDLVATALATCILTTLGIIAQRLDIDLVGAKITIGKEMNPTAPRRISQLTLAIFIPISVTHPHRERLENAARACPVHLSLHPEVEQSLAFQWAPL